MDPELGVYKTLEEAIAVAEEGTIIKLEEGVYTCNIVIDKPGIKIEPRYKDRPVYLLGNEGPVIKIDMKNREDRVVIKRILLAHSGLNLVKKFKSVQERFTFENPKKANPKTIINFDINKNMDTVVLVRKGCLVMRNCLISLRSLPKNLIQRVPSLVALPHTSVNLINCEFMGNEHNITAGCVFTNCDDVVMSSTTFTHFKGGAVFSVSEENQHTII